MAGRLPTGVASLGYCYASEEEYVTLQVAFVGTDGIVLASDKKMGRPFENQFESSLTSKIRLNVERGLVTAWSGDWPACMDLADKAMALSDTELLDPHFPLQELAKEVFEGRRRRLGNSLLNGELILVMSRDVNHIHHVTVKGESYSHRADENKATSGYHTSSGLSFSEMFYEKRPMKELLGLAAHVITTAEWLNPIGIEGLEIICCTREKILKVPENEISELVAWSNNLTADIKRLLFPPS